jgi:hypothetical protein
MSDGKVSKVSRLEGHVAVVLDTLGIPYTRQAAIRCPSTGRFVACADFLLGDGRVVEVNGTYWHADPRVYPNGPVYPSQRHTADRYHDKLARLKAMGVNVLELWELDINTDPTMCLKEALHVDP